MRSRTSMPGIYSSLHNKIVHFPMCHAVCTDQDKLDESKYDQQTYNIHNLYLPN